MHSRASSEPRRSPLRPWPHHLLTLGSPSVKLGPPHTFAHSTPSTNPSDYTMLARVQTGRLSSKTPSSFAWRRGDGHERLRMVVPGVSRPIPQGQELCSRPNSRWRRRAVDPYLWFVLLAHAGITHDGVITSIDAARAAPIRRAS